MTVIEVHDVTVRYGRRSAIEQVSLRVEPGSVYGLLGRNGAGKSSLVRCLLGFRRPEGGSAELFGSDVWKNRRRLMNRVGIVPEEADAPPEMSVEQIGAFSRSLHATWDEKAFRQRLDRFGISRSSRFGQLSKGQKKEVSLSLALSMRPELLVLDDPTLGLDVVSRKALYEEVVGDLADRGTTMFLTTHDLTGMEMIADRVGILKDGRLVLDESLETLKTRFRRVRVPNQLVAVQGSVLSTSVRRWGSGTEAVLTNFEEGRFGPDAEVTPMSLEEIFIAIAGEEGQPS